MTNEKCFFVTRKYMRRLGKMGPGGRNQRLRHVFGMLPQMQVFLLEEDRREKFMRWLGFVQGVLWCEGIYTIEQMKKHNADPVPVRRPRAATSGGGL